MSELRISLRRLLRSPGYLAAAILSLAIGMNTRLLATRPERAAPSREDS